MDSGFISTDQMQKEQSEPMKIMNKISGKRERRSEKVENLKIDEFLVFLMLCTVFFLVIFILSLFFFLFRSLSLCHHELWIGDAISLYLDVNFFFIFFLKPYSCVCVFAVLCIVLSKVKRYVDFFYIILSETMRIRNANSTNNAGARVQNCVKYRKMWRCW